MEKLNHFVIGRAHFVETCEAWWFWEVVDFVRIDGEQTIEKVLEDVLKILE